MSYHSFIADDGTKYGSFETFEIDAHDCVLDEDGEPVAAGWYWQACFPGCLPDGDPSGPFESEQAAIDDAQEN